LPAPALLVLALALATAEKLDGGAAERTRIQQTMTGQETRNKFTDHWATHEA